MTMPRNFASFVLMGLASAPPLAAQTRTSPADSALAHSIMTELVGIRSVSGSGETVTASRAIVARLRNAGFSEADAFVVGTADTVGNVVARLRGRSVRSPVLLMAHLDVVPALREDWSTDPFMLTETGGWWYARGVSDNKAGVVTIVANLIRWKKAGYVPDHDIVAVITGDEETLGNQINWFASGDGRKHIGNPVIALNFDTGGGAIYRGRPAVMNVQTAEKVYVSYRLTVRNRGGHSAQPRPDNAIYSLARALTRVASVPFPVEITPTTRLTLRRSAAFEADSVARLMRAVAAERTDTAAARRLTSHARFNSMLRTTCVATRLSGGHADNALPQTAQATVNCRMMPGTDTTVVARTLRSVIDDPAVELTQVEPATLSPPSPVTPQLLSTLERVSSRFWPGVSVVPAMSSGATDGAFVRNAGIPVYGLTGIFFEPGDSRSHGRDERVEIRRFYEGLEFGKAIVEAVVSMK